MGKIGIVSVLAMALTAALSGDSPNKAKIHGYSLSGTITSVDESRKSFVVKNAAGKDTTLLWTAATKVAGGQLKAGANVTLRFLNKDGKHIATSVVIAEPVVRNTPSPGPATTPTASR